MSAASTNRPIAKSGSAVLLSQIGLLLFNLFFTVYFVRVLSKTEFAVITVLDILISIFGFSEMGLLSVASQQAPSKLQSNSRAQALALAKCAFRYRSLVILLFGAITVVFAPSMSQLLLKTPEYSWAVILLTLGAMGTTWYYTLQGIAKIYQDFYLLARWNLVSGILRQALALLAFLFFGLPGYLVGTVASIYITMFGMGWSLRKTIFNDIPAAPFWPTFRYGFPFYIRSFLRFGFLQYDQLLVATLLTPETLAVYSVVRKLTKFISLITDSFQAPITMRMSALRDEPDKVQSGFFNKVTRYTTFITLPLCTLIALTSPWIMQIYGGEKYANEWPVLVIMTIAQAAYAFYGVYSGAVFASLKPWAILLADGIVGVTNMLVAPMLILGLEKYGVAWGQLLGYIFGILCARAMLRRRSDFNFDWNGLRLIGIPLVLASSLIVVGQALLLQWWSVPVYLLIAGLIYILVTGRRFHQEDWDQIRILVPEPLAPIYNRIRSLLQGATSS